MITHDQIVSKETHLMIYIDESEINDEIDVSIVILLFSNDNNRSIIVEKRQAYLDLLSNYTIYSRELIELNLILKIMKTYLDDRSIIIFVDNQIAIQALSFFRQQSDQYMLRNLIKKLTTSDKRSHLHSISTHEEVSENEAIDEAIKKIIK